MNKLLEFQKEVGAISKDSTNPFFKSKYFDINALLDEVKPLLNKHGLVLLQPLTNILGRPAIRTIIADASDGKYLVDDIITMPDLQDPQKMGSCTTYYRRYSLQSALGLQAEDDDANFASQQQVKQATQTIASAPVTPTNKFIFKKQ